MPELPEVETVARRLRPQLVGRSFVSAEIIWNRSVQTPSADLLRNLPGKRVLDVSRRGKFIWIRLSHGDHLLVHLRMTGDLRLVSGRQARSAHDRVVFGLDDGCQLRFKDQRKFGRLHFLQDPARILETLGPEPLDPAFTENDFVCRLAGRKRLIKPLLLDQTFLAGLGNIYADESLFDAGIRPDRRSDSLSDIEKRRLFSSIRRVLLEAIHHNGSTLADQAFPGGEFQENFQVYGRTGQPCLRCGLPIVRLRLAQRSSHWCPACQH